MQPPQTNEQLIFGVRKEWKTFRKDHAIFLERFPNLMDALHAAFPENRPPSEPIDRFVLLYGRLCCEDFFEVLLCCSNGYGAAALKLLRSLYEHAVTLRYLHDHPDKLSDFRDYRAVSAYKEIVAIEESFGKRENYEAYSASVRERYERVKEKFKVTDCKECGTEKTNHTWSNLNFPAMAKTTGTLGKLIYSGYYTPLRHAHGTIAALFHRLEISESGGFSFPTDQKGLADSALVTAHNILLEVMKVQQERFQLPGLDDKIKICDQDYLEMNLKKGSTDTE